MSTKKLYIKPSMKVYNIDTDIILVHQSVPTDPDEDDWDDWGGNKNATKSSFPSSTSTIGTSQSTITGKSFVNESPFD